MFKLMGKKIINFYANKIPLSGPMTQYADENDIESVFCQSLENLPGLRVEVDPGARGESFI